ncbi:hypothetical protein GTP19_17940 [Vibrio cholerae]|nr:hypothetical protein [Vibrio cholerae]
MNVRKILLPAIYTKRSQQEERARAPNKRLKRDCQRVAFPVPMSRGGYSCCV